MLNQYFSKGADIQIVDLSLFASAAFYVLDDKAERNRSVADLENFFFRLLGVLKPELFIEAGARDGASSVRARRNTENSRIVAFEANPLNYELHKNDKRLADANVEYVHKALGDKSGEITFNVQIVGGKDRANGQGSMLHREAAEGEKPVTVDSVRLDEFFQTDSFKGCCIWMDVEGATQQVLEGALNILSKVDVLYVEVEDRPYWHGQWLSSDVMSYLYDFDLVPVARDFQSRYQYNILFISRETLKRDRVRFVLAEHISRVGSKVSKKND